MASAALVSPAPRTVALTGATGFIGGVVARLLPAAGWRVRALIRPGAASQALTELDLHWVEGSLEDSDSLRRLVTGVYAVIHCAGAVRGRNQAQFNRVNVEGVARLVQAARDQLSVPRFLLLSSLAAREPSLSPYAASKREGERVLLEQAGEMPWLVLRPPAVYGPGDRELLPLWRAMGRGIAPVLGATGARLSLLYVDDLAAAVLQWLGSGGCAPGIFELHDGRPGGYTWDEVVDSAAQLYGRSIRRIPVAAPLLRVLAAVNLLAAGLGGYAPMLTLGKVRELRHPDWVCDNTALSRALSWTPRVTLEAGLRRTLGWNLQTALGHYP